MAAARRKHAIDWNSIKFEGSGNTDCSFFL